MPRVLGTAARREPSHAGSWYDSDGEPQREGVWKAEERVEGGCVLDGVSNKA